MALMGIFAILNMKQETWLTTLGFWANIKIVLLVSKEDFLILDMKFQQKNYKNYNNFLKINFESNPS